MADLVKKIRTSSGDLQIDYNALANLPGNQNLLINANFKAPINQRNRASYTYTTGNTGKVYTIDRWWLNGVGAKLVFNDGYMAVTLPTGCDFGQALEMDYKDYDSLTVSIKLKDDATVKTATFSNVSTMNESTEAFVNLTSAIKAGIFVFGYGVYMYLRPVSGSISMNLEWIKLESGSVATPFVPRPYQYEHWMCQYYYRVLSNGFFLGIATATSESIVMPITGIDKMRVDEPKLIVDNLIFNPLSNNPDKYVTITGGYAMLSSWCSIASFVKADAAVGEVGRIYGTIILDAEYD